MRLFRLRVDHVEENEKSVIDIFVPINIFTQCKKKLKYHFGSLLFE